MYVVLECFIVAGFVMLVGVGLFLATALVLLVRAVLMLAGREVKTLLGNSYRLFSAFWRRGVPILTQRFAANFSARRVFGLRGAWHFASPRRNCSRNEESMNMKQTTDEYYREVVARAEEAARLAEVEQRLEHLRSFNFGRTVQRIQNSRYDRWQRVGWLVVGLAIGLACGRIYPDPHASTAHKLVSQSSQIVRVADKP
jgi:hypothetical protein